MKDWYTGSCILILGICVLMSALPDYREMDRKEEFLRHCIADIKNKDIEEWGKLGVCNQMWNEV